MVFRGNGAEISRRQQSIKRDYANQQPVGGGGVVDKNITDPHEGDQVNYISKLPI